MALDEIYQEIILDHYKNPRNRGMIENPDIDVYETNPLCGDELGVQATMAGDAINELKFHGKGCSISQASASIMTELLAKSGTAKAEKYIRAIKDLMNGKQTMSDDELEDLIALKGVSKYPARVKCALLAWTTLELGLLEHRGAHTHDHADES